MGQLLKNNEVKLRIILIINIKYSDFSLMVKVTLTPVMIKANLFSDLSIGIVLYEFKICQIHKSSSN